MSLDALIFPALIVVALAQVFVNWRTLDQWTLSLRRERALAACLNALASDDEDEIREAFEAVVVELDRQMKYERSRWWFQRAPGLGKEWSSR